MKKIIIVLAILLIAVPVFSADYAVIKELRGRVEVQSPGGGWVKASVGDSLPQGGSISTGFGSSAVLEVGASILSVDALTRMKLEELVQQNNNQTTGLFLRVGRVNAEVKRDQGLTHDFKLRSPSSTAAVRGTNFTFDGKKVTVHKGAVAMISSALAREVLVSANESSEVGSNGRQSDPASEKKKSSSTSGSAVQKENTAAQSGASQSGSDGDSGQSGGGSPVETFGSIVITVN